MDLLTAAAADCEPNWDRFYDALVRLGPLTLKGIPVEWVRWFQLEGKAADLFWSEYIEESLFSRWKESPELAVREAVKRYAESVQTVLSEFPYSDEGPGWQADPLTGDLMPRSECIARIGCNPVRSRVLRTLLAAASQPCEGE